jgi:plasmid replication initiation protein
MTTGEIVQATKKSTATEMDTDPELQNSDAKRRRIEQDEDSAIAEMRRRVDGHDKKLNDIEVRLKRNTADLKKVSGNVNSLVTEGKLKEMMQKPGHSEGLITMAMMPGRAAPKKHETACK